ncbi:MAG: hypothetical protein OES09_15805 [Gammaproteobacteria bacterium]|nr:hypothetical protein [Gammaproteobacteria bacterium]
MFNWKAGRIKGEKAGVHGARITVDNIWMVRYLLTGNPDRVHVAPKRYLINRGTRKNPLFTIVRQGKFTATS